ncbi:uncharacterized protein BJX67DRAFT_371673 [Aspergillus lucknowensis]|uniref:Alpha-ketoglutarate-dependent sulfonate dioxygenase n=1 Tax=Aspergillus lucknowensis TaxID=176173 RepID=A0ABR4LTW7_9EURO
MGMSDGAAPDTEQQQTSGDKPPTYTRRTDQLPAVPALNLSQDAGPARYTTVTHFECISHLKFLAALSDLRDTVTSTPNVFSIPDPTPREFGSQINEAWALVKEKRWGVFTTKAVERYTVWWNVSVPASRPRPTVHQLSSTVYDDITACSNPLTWTRDELPPIDILMVWHAHMLNPRAFLEDCIRYGKMSFWSGGFPWRAVNECIDDRTLAYDTGKVAVRAFFTRTSLEWDNLEDMPTKTFQCPSCGHGNSTPWTSGKFTAPLDPTFEYWRGFADKNFGTYCARCHLSITHETLRVQKFRTDVSELLDGYIPMPGTLFNLWGVPERLSSTRRRKQQADFPNRLIRAAKRDFREYMRSSLWVCPSVTMLRDYLGALIQDRDTMRAAQPNSIQTSLLPEEKIAFRRMMSRYWDNSSQFAVDLVGAVVRQGTFIQKMDNIDWLHSPALMETMHRLIRKYAVFFQIMSSNPGRMAVPTLDVDLAWHTHQLSPGRYYEYSIHRTEQDGKRAIFIDHDDKVSETKLSDSFEWTSKMYRKITDGEIYSECTCWYCEATRHSDLHGKLFMPSSSGAKARNAAANLHDNPNISSHPDKNPHISSHSAVRTKYDTATLASGIDPSRLKFLKLRSEYEKARRRAAKRSSRYGKAAADGGEKHCSKDDDDKNRDLFGTYPLMWGYPVFVPYYGPYTCDPSVHCDAYASDPSCMNLNPGNPGNCVSGTCGGAVVVEGVVAEGVVAEDVVVAAVEEEEEDVVVVVEVVVERCSSCEDIF